MNVIEIFLLIWAIIATLCAVGFHKNWRHEQRSYRAFARGVGDSTEYLNRFSAFKIPLIGLAVLGIILLVKKIEESEKGGPGSE